MSDRRPDACEERAGNVPKGRREDIGRRAEEALARALGVSRFHLSHVFSEKIGQGFSAYLASIRIDCACALLAGTNRSVTEIAAESGFESQRSFFRAFGARCGMTPLAYRRRAQGTQAQK